MQTTALPPETIAFLARELAVKARTSGPVILGAQLGKLINDALTPRRLREFGGLRSFADAFLSRLVRQREYDPLAPDVEYEIINVPAPADRPLVAPTAFQGVAGTDLWRFFSNPNVKCQLAVLDAATVVVGAEGATMPAAAVPLSRFGTPDYRRLAETFASQYTGDMGIGTTLLEILKKDDFYKEWITTLRALRAEQSDLLRKWEILREETVAQALTDALGNAGVDAARVAEIVQLARPIAKAVARPSPATLGGHAALGAPTERPKFKYLSPSQVFSGGAPAGFDEAEELRKLVHRAVDAMSLAELREIRLSATTLMTLTIQHRM